MPDRRRPAGSKWVVALGSEEFKKREVAEKRLIEAGAVSVIHVSGVLKATKEVEVRTRATRILRAVAIADASDLVWDQLLPLANDPQRTVSMPMRNVLKEAVCIQMDNLAKENNPLKVLKVGENYVFQTSKGTIKGSLRRVEGDFLGIRVKAKINKHSIEYERGIRLADLTPACRDRLQITKKSKIPLKSFYGAIAALNNNDLQKAHTSLQPAAPDPSALRYIKRIKQMMQWPVKAEHKPPRRKLPPFSR